MNLRHHHGECNPFDPEISIGDCAQPIGITINVIMPAKTPSTTAVKMILFFIISGLVSWASGFPCGGSIHPEGRRLGIAGPP
jgi:hypothetical protein